MKSILWLRRDFRTRDQPAFEQACAAGPQVTPVFALDPEVIGPRGAGAKPSASFFGALLKLRDRFRAKDAELLALEGDPAERIPALCRAIGAGSLFFNRDYEPGSLLRDEKVTRACAEIGVKIRSFKDHVLFEKDEILNGSGEPYKVFTAYKRACLKELARNPQKPGPAAKLGSLARGQELPKALRSESDRVWRKIEEKVAAGRDEAAPFGGLPEPGEAAARKRLDLFVRERLADYEKLRDFPAADGTSRLSADLRSGSLSPRQVLEAVGGPRKREVFVSELLWRDFFIMIGFQFPRVFEGNFNSKYDSIRWRNEDEDLRAWREGRTGYPIVDAGMRELVRTGFMHNRVRMITAMFLVKDLLVDWRMGEKFFLEHLIDSEAAVNNGNWQWCASTGTDAQPYFRVFNPITQGKRFDPDGDYIRRHVEERANLDRKAVHQLIDPVVDHEMARMRILTAYRRARD